jgi:hypothetical protein
VVVVVVEDLTEVEAVLVWAVTEMVSVVVEDIIAVVAVVV